MDGFRPGTNTFHRLREDAVPAVAGEEPPFAERSAGAVRARVCRGSGANAVGRTGPLLAEIRGQQSDVVFLRLAERLEQPVAQGVEIFGP